MGEDYQILEIIFLAAIAVFVLLRLRSVLGRRTGHERRRDSVAARESMPSSSQSNDNSVNGAGQAAEDSAGEASSSRIDSVAPQGSALNQTLTEIQLADRQFDIDGFIGGARAAYQIIVEAYGKGDKAALKPLLSDSVFNSFGAAIDERSAADQTMEFELVGIKEAQITAAKLEDRQVEVTVSFETEIVTSVKSADGEIVSGDPTTVVTVIDVWSFARDVKAKTPDWLLVDTDTVE